MTDERLLFDRKLLRERRARFAHEIAARELVLAHVAGEIAERVGLMLRPFPLALDLGAYHGLLGRKVAELPSVGAMIYAESALALAARCPRPALVCDEDVLPFKDASLNLIVSGLALHRVNDLPGALIQIRRALHPDGLFMAALLGARRAVGIERSADRGRGRDRRRGKPARRPVRRRARLWRVAAARRLRAAGGRRRNADGALCEPRRRDARNPRARRRQRAARPQPAAARAPHASARRRDLSRAPRHAGRQGEREFRDRLSERLGSRPEPAEAAQAGQRRAASRRRARHHRAAGRRQGGIPGQATR